MKKFLQNKIAESKQALPLTMGYSTLVWLASGLIGGGWWIQFFCFVLSAFLMMELNTIHALIRIFSRMVSCVFVVLLCMLCFLFSSIPGAITQVFTIAAIMLLFNSYQDKAASGWVFYSFLMTGFASLVFIHILFYLPILWLVMFFQLQTFSLRTWAASLIGVFTPYWCWSSWLGFQGDLTPLFDHFLPLGEFQLPFDLRLLNSHHLVTFVFVVILAIAGTVHYVRKHHDDKIRTRLFYGSFIWISITTMIFILLQPQHFDVLIRILIINTAPLLGHFLALTRTRQTNIAFFAMSTIALLITVYNLWM